MIPICLTADTLLLGGRYGPEVNLFVDHSQIVQLECVRSGIWVTAATWGRVLTYKGEAKKP